MRAAMLCFKSFTPRFYLSSSKLNMISVCNREHKWFLLFLSVIVVYLIAMDVQLYYHMQDRTPLAVQHIQHQTQDSPAAAHLSSSTLSISAERPAVAAAAAATTMDRQLAAEAAQRRIQITPYANISIKFIWLDHFDLYIATPLAASFAKLVHFHQVLFFVTPNMISAAGVLMGLLSGRLVASQTRSIIMLGLLAQLLRNFFDALDGIIAKSRAEKPSKLGFWIDGVADGLGITAFVLGVYFHLQGSRKAGYTLLSTNNSKRNSKFDVEKDGAQNMPITHKRTTFYLVLCYGMLLSLTALFWNIFVAAYHNLLEEIPRTQQQANLQNAIIKSSIMWLVALLWRLFNTFSLMEMLLIAIYLGKTWEFLIWIQYLGFAILSIIIAFTGIFYHDVSSFLKTTDNSIVSGSS